MKHRTNYTQDLHKNSPGENIDYKTDLCVPDQSLSLDEIILRFASGQPVNGGRPSYYGGETLDTFDPTQHPGNDVIDIQNEYDQVTTRIKQTKANKQAAEAKKAAEKASATAAAKRGSEAEEQRQGRGATTSAAEGRAAVDENV